jgi:GNAT superfamily N-acetyltransferase
METPRLQTSSVQTSSLEVRAAVAADYDAYARLLPELGTDDPIPPRARWEANMLRDTLIVERIAAGERATAGYSWTRRFDDAAYVFNVVVAPEHRGAGAGAALMAAIAERARASGATRWALNVKIDNVPAIRLYERFGFASAYRSTALSLPWERVLALPRDAARIVARAVRPDEDAHLEAEFSVLPGRLADYRVRGRVLLVLVDERSSAAVGLAVFDPTNPGAFPFTVARPTLARSLLEAMRPHARPQDTFVRVVVENDAPLTDALGRAGAEVRFEMHHMEGAIPRAA